MFPYCLSIGMTCDQFWNDDWELIKSYLKAEEIRQNRVNQEAWLQGRYFYVAMAQISPILHAFAKKGTKPEEYLSDPFSLVKRSEQKNQESTAKTTTNKAKVFMDMFMVRTNQKMKGGGENGDNH